MTNQVSTADRVMARIGDAARDDITKKIDSAFDALVVNAQPEVKLPEQVFVHHFLPYFSGQKPMTKEDRVIENWVAIAGTPTNEVAIVGNDGAVLFNVPPVFDTSSLDVTTRNVGESMGDIYAGFAMRRNNIPAVANTYLAASLDNKHNEIVNEPTGTVQKRWQAIMDRYNIAGAKPAVATSTVGDDEPNDDLVYD